MLITSTDVRERMNEIYKITSMLTESKPSQLSDILKVACGLLNVEVGVISKIDGENYEIIDIFSVKNNLALKGITLKTEQTFCDIAINEDGVVDISDVKGSIYKNHLCYKDFTIGSYIGVPVWINGKTYGTLSFSSSSKRVDSFDQYDRDFVQYLGQWLSNFLEKSFYEKDIAIKNQQLLILNEKLESNNDYLQKIIKEKDILTQILVHDLKSPLTNIKMLSFLFEDFVTNEESLELMNIFNKCLQDVFHLIGQMETLNIMENSVINVLPEPMDLNSFMIDIVTNFSKTAADKDIKLNLKPLKEPSKLVTDHNVLTRIINNLISNALKFSPFNKTINIALNNVEENFTISVSDQGPGISEADQKKLFTRFSMLSAKPTNNESSSGLGLYIVKELSKTIEGEVFLESKLGKGSTFIIKIPANLSV